LFQQVVKSPNWEQPQLQVIVNVSTKKENTSVRKRTSPECCLIICFIFFLSQIFGLELFKRINKLEYLFLLVKWLLLCYMMLANLVYLQNLLSNFSSCAVSKKGRVFHQVQIACKEVSKYDHSHYSVNWVVRSARN
jgi:hypothetical protein